MEIEKHLNWDEPQIWVKSGCFDFTITKNEIQIVCDWDYGYGGRGTETFTIGFNQFKELLNELENETDKNQTP